MAGDTVPSAARHRGAMSYERTGAGRDRTGAADCRRAFFRGAGRAGSTGFQALGCLALRGGRCGSRAAARGRRGADAGPDAGTDAGPDAGTGARASGTAAGSAASDGGNRTNGRAAAVGSGGSPRSPAVAGAAPGAARGASGTGEGCTVTHPEAMTSAASVRGRARRSCIRPPCRTGAARTGTRHTVG